MESEKKSGTSSDNSNQNNLSFNLWAGRHITEWLPTSKKEIVMRDWDQLDVIIYTGDAYIDHPSFGAAVIGRVIESAGLKVAIIPQPNWKDDLRDFRKLGIPKLFFGVTSGSMDSMVNHYTANIRLRSDDAYSPGGKSGFRPDYATTVYSQILKKLYPEVPIIIGGIEASMRRLSHYDYWSDSVKPSILFDSQADLLVYGMGEQAILDIVNYLIKGIPFDSLQNISQTAFLDKGNKNIAGNKKWDDIQLFSHEETYQDKAKFASNFRIFEEESNKRSNGRLIQKIGNNTLYINPPYPLMSNTEIDAIYDLPYTRLPHPRYSGKGKIPAYEMIKFSINIHRGCFGGCSFCAISAHQGKNIVSRSEKSILKEVESIVKMPDFKGYISDIGGPTANMYKMQGKDDKVCEKCQRASCIYPSICSNMNTDHQSLLDLYKKIRQTNGIKKAFIGSGIRFDLFFDKNGNLEKSKEDYIKELLRNHISGRLKLAPEHTVEKVLKLMRKPGFETFKKFKTVFDSINIRENLRLEIVPYFISSHPGCESADMAELAIETKNLKFKLEQVQDFTPTPMTLATTIYYTGINPYTLEKIFSAKSQNDKKLQKLFFFWYENENSNQIKKELLKIIRPDLIRKLFKLKLS